MSKKDLVITVVETRERTFIVSAESMQEMFGVVDEKMDSINFEDAYRKYGVRYNGVAGNADRLMYERLEDL